MVTVAVPGSLRKGRRRAQSLCGIIVSYLGLGPELSGSSGGGRHHTFSAKHHENESFLHILTVWV